jgi:type III pantothenate kinase
MTLLAIDVGNTNTVFGAFSSDQPTPQQWRASTAAHRTGDEWMVTVSAFLATASLTLADISGIVIASVVPDVTVALRRMCARVGKDALVVTWQTAAGLDIRLDDPKEIGADRIANAVEVFASYGGPAIVVDMGTATTLDVVSQSGAYLGGVIMPGLQISLDALFASAAALKRIDISVPSDVVGTNTLSALQSGATYGYAAQVDGLCARIEEKVGACNVVATGGLSSVVSSVSRSIQTHDPTLTLRGLRLIYERSTASS